MYRVSNNVGMYDRRVKICVGAALLVLLIGVSRLVQIQLLADSKLQEEIAALKRQKGQSQLFGTVRGDILDRNGNVLATDIPRFQVVVSYRLTSFADHRVVEVLERRARTEGDDPSLYDFYTAVAARGTDLEKIIRDCAKFGVSERNVAIRIREINDYVWGQRAFIAWVRNGPDPNFVARYGNRINSIPLADAMPEFERQVPDQLKRYDMIMEVDDIPLLDKSFGLLDLRTEDDVFAAQVEFMDIDNVEIVPTGYRHYPYGSAAAQTIGWVGRAQEPDKALFEHDPLAQYLPGDICGRQPGVEYVCEAILRGRRGQRATDIDGHVVSDTRAQFGQDVQLTLDIELQQRIEQYVRDYRFNPYATAPTAIVVLDIRTGDILALVSLPTYDLNRVRYDYGDLSADPNEPLRNRAINEHYPPGSSVKPIILVAGLESGAITAEEPISCPSQPAPSGWPNCLIWNDYRSGHDTRWTNYARNAVKGSCNIYFSRLADRIDNLALQRWLFLFGYGHRTPLENTLPSPVGGSPRQFLQDPGQISWHPPAKAVTSLEDVPPMRDVDKRLFGIGQGNLWATPLQVANAFATLARGGQYKPPRLFLQPRASASLTPEEPIDLQISAATLQTVYDGMSAVVNESGGTAYRAFRSSGLGDQGVKVYGKTGSTESPYNACFAGFAEDSDGAKIAVAVVVEGGQSGSSDAAPLGREVIQYCVEQGYVGTPTTMPPLP